LRLDYTCGTVGAMSCSLLALLCFTAWQPHTVALEAIGDSLIAIDGLQTSHIAREGFVERESDFAIGRYPSSRSTAEYFGGLALAHVLITNALVKVGLSDVFQGLTIGWEGSTVVANYRRGIRL
jgi:hypothetical protein